MEIRKTVTKEADIELDELLGKENRIYKPKQLNDMDITSVRLSSTSDELALFLYESAYIRPEFKVENNLVQIPCFFTKIEGDIAQYTNSANDFMRAHNKLATVTSGYNMLERKGVLLGLREGTIVDGRLNLEVAMKNPKISFLKPEKKKNYINAINRLLEWMDMGIVEKPENINDVVDTLLNNNQKIVEMFHEADYQDTPPKYFIIASQKRAPEVMAVYRMLLMHALGFDVVIACKDGYSGIENHLDSMYYDNHNIQKKADIMPDGNLKHVGVKNIAFWAAIIVILLIILKIIF